MALSLSPPPAAMTAEDFIVSDSNREAWQWIMRWPHWPSYALILIGPHLSGKTHLASVWQARTGFKPVEAAESMEEEALFHLLNRAQLEGRSLLLTSAAPPETWPLALPDVRSRLQAQPRVFLRDPDEALLEALLIKLLSDRQLSVPPEIPAFLARRIERSFQAAYTLAEALDQTSLSHGCQITLPLARDVLSSLLTVEHGEQPRS